MFTDPAAVTRPPHMLWELTSTELASWKRQLEHAIEEINAHDPVQAEFRNALEDVKAEEESRAKIAEANGLAWPMEVRDLDGFVKSMSVAELEQLRRDLNTSLALMRPTATTTPPTATRSSSGPATAIPSSYGAARNSEQLWEPIPFGNA